MTKYEIEELARCNDVIKNAWQKFKKARIPYREILDVYSMSHFVKPIEEAYIKYIDINGNKKSYCYYIDYSE